MYWKVPRAMEVLMKKYYSFSVHPALKHNHVCNYKEKCSAALLLSVFSMKSVKKRNVASKKPGKLGIA